MSIIFLISNTKILLTALLIEYKKYLPVILVTSLFFLGTYFKRYPNTQTSFKKSCRSTDFQSAFINDAYWIAYFIVALPAGRVMQKYAYKKTLVRGLLIAATGTFLFYPAAAQKIFAFFLAVLLIVAAGIMFPEIAVNSCMSILRPTEWALQGLNIYLLAIKGLGEQIKTAS